ncbi:MAG: L,D-transpeptidase family protein, partial [Bdellovibrio sp.]|nr:L,D-transpeptidase family protein [Bdellovibrio sp.]
MPNSFAQTEPHPVIGLVVDKKTNTVHVVDFDKSPLVISKSYHATLGLVPGDKEKEGDKKTPEGIYFFDEIRKPPRLQPKFGSMAITMNYPNTWDKFVGHTGSGIWLHSTNEPDRLNKNFDSLGCVVVNNDQMAQISSDINYRTSPVAIYEDLNTIPEVLSPERMTVVKKAIMDWAESWSKKDLDRYMTFYHPKFKSAGKDIKMWRDYKSQLNRQYAVIKVDIINLTIIPHPKYDVALFTQV